MATPDTDGGAKLVLYGEEDGTVPVLDWFDGLPPRARAKVYVRLERLAARGLRAGRGEVKMLHHGLYELRSRHVGVGYFVYLFRHGLASIVLVHGLAAKPKRNLEAVEVSLAR